MDKYDPVDPTHRLKLAENILSFLEKWDFSIDATHHAVSTWEFVFSREDKSDKSKKIYVYSGIQKRDGSMRPYSSDRIKVVAGRFENESEFIVWFKQQLNKSGSFKSIKGRLCEAILAAQSSKSPEHYKINPETYASMITK